MFKKGSNPEEQSRGSVMSSHTRSGRGMWHKGRIFYPRRSRQQSRILAVADHRAPLPSRGSESSQRHGEKSCFSNSRPRKGLRLWSGQLTELFPSLDEKMLDEILPEGQAKAMPRLKKLLPFCHCQWAKVVKLDNRCLLYSCGDAAPAFFDSEGRGEPGPKKHIVL